MGSGWAVNYKQQMVNRRFIWCASVRLTSAPFHMSLNILAHKSFQNIRWEIGRLFLCKKKTRYVSPSIRCTKDDLEIWARVNESCAHCTSSPYGEQSNLNIWKYLLGLNGYRVETKYCYVTSEHNVRTWPWAKVNGLCAAYIVLILWTFVTSCLKIPLGVEVLQSEQVNTAARHLAQGANLTLSQGKWPIRYAHRLSVVYICD